MSIVSTAHQAGFGLPPRHSLLAAGIAAALLVPTLTAQAHDNEVAIHVDGGERCIVGNGLPDHATGTFPNRGNPHTMSPQNIQLCVPANPVRNNRPTDVRGSIGVALNGVQFRPGTADYYDAGSPRGFSRDRSSGWNLEGLGAADALGMDANNAHVDERGLYHYHGVADALVRSTEGSLIGYAADGFEIHYVGQEQTPSYRLKSGSRVHPPGGSHDGTFVEDWVHVAGSGTLDQCNGGTLNGRFVYFATDAYPFLPRCLWGDVSDDFARGAPGGNRFLPARRQLSHAAPHPRHHRPPTTAGHRPPPHCGPTPAGAVVCARPGGSPRRH